MTNNTFNFINVLVTNLIHKIIDKTDVKGINLYKITFLIAFITPIFLHINVQAQQFKTESFLASGDIYKISVAEAGLYKLDFNFLKDQVGIANLAEIDAKNIKIYSNGGGPLPHLVGAQQIDDAEEVLAYRNGLDDGSFQSGDYILFYAEGASHWQLQNNTFRYAKNNYDDFNYFFIKIDNSSAIAMEERASSSTDDAYVSETYNDFQVVNKDDLNLLAKYRSPGSGNVWFADEYKGNTREYSYSDDFDLTNLNVDDTLSFQVRMAVRAPEFNSAQYHFEIDGSKFTKDVSGIDMIDFEEPYARFGVLNGSWPQTSQSPSLKVEFPSNNPSGSEAWMDYIELNARKNLQYANAPLLFRDLKSNAALKTSYIVSNGSNSLTLLDITNPLRPINQNYNLQGSDLAFTVQNNEAIQTFLLFDPNADYTKPTFVEKVENQNLHGLQSTDMIILYHRDFKDAAEELAAHRSMHSGYDVTTVEIATVYNEFGGGGVDVTAIRDMVEMVHERSDKFKYLLLLGDASYDFRHRNTGNPDDNFIPVYQTLESFDPIFAYPSDDYFVMLDDDEGADISKGKLNIAVGRIPCRTSEEGLAVVQKIINYDTNPTTLGDWRNRLLFLADDEDRSLHLDQIDRIARVNATEHPIYNQEKIYIDAYQQISTPGGERYPDVTEAINNNIFKGVLVFNYLGHGGQEGLAQERILRAQNLAQWENVHKLPLFVTATCSFTGFDEPAHNTAGEQSIMNPNGGVIALFSTARAVYAGDNEKLTKAVFDNLFDKIDGKYPTIGEIMRISKNQVLNNSSSSFNENTRKFFVIGDPSMTLAYPEYEVITTEMNGQATQDGIMSDTISALDEVQIKGRIEDAGTHLTSFNGVLNVTVFDKALDVKTLLNDSGSQLREFKIQNRTIFKGKASVVNGNFEFSFVVPKDINFSIGAGRMSYYATDELSIDARGLFDDFAVGGTSNSAIVDDKGPEVQLFMDDLSFQNGGTTGASPVLIVKLKDDFGINVAGTSIGHDLEAVIDDNSQNSFILNDFYEAEVDDFTSGEAQFRFFDLEKGPHQVAVTAWDIANNFTEATLDFIVSDNVELAIKNLINYPNPVSGKTFFRFQHNKPGAQVDVEVDIFNTRGQRMAQLEFPNVISNGNTVDQLEWDATNNVGADLVSGIYFFSVKLISRSGKGEEIGQSTFEKMVIIK